MDSRPAGDAAPFAVGDKVRTGFSEDSRHRTYIVISIVQKGTYCSTGWWATILAPETPRNARHRKLELDSGWLRPA